MTIDEIMDLQKRYEDVKISIPTTFDNTQKISIKGQNIEEIQEAEKTLLEIVSDKQIIQVTFSVVAINQF